MKIFNINSFINYFDNGWKIDVIPKISLNNRDDELYRVLVVEKFLDRNPQYSDRLPFAVKNVPDNPLENHTIGVALLWSYFCEEIWRFR